VLDPLVELGELENEARRVGDLSARMPRRAVYQSVGKPRGEPGDARDSHSLADLADEFLLEISDMPADDRQDGDRIAGQGQKGCS